MSNINEAPSTGDSNMSLQRICCRNICFGYFIAKNDAFDGRNGDETNDGKVFPHCHSQYCLRAQHKKQPADNFAKFMPPLTLGANPTKHILPTDLCTQQKVHV